MTRGLRHINGKAVPAIYRVHVSYFPEVGEPWVYEPKWNVEFPDEYEWDCCRQTEFKKFDTYHEALHFALDRTWERTWS